MGKIGTWSLDIKQNILNWTDEAYRIFGVTPGTPLTYEIFLSCIYPDDREWVDQAWNQGQRTGNYDIEHRLLTDGKIRWVREKAEITFDDSGQPVSTMGFTQDITDRKAAEEELKAANQQLAASEQQLRAANQQLRASEQQLSASENQLRAANQQLAASEQQLRAAAEELRAHRNNLEDLVKRRTRELEEKNRELERYYDAFVGRELRMKELYDENKALKAELGKNE